MIGLQDLKKERAPIDPQEERWTARAASSRRLARVVAVQALYESDLTGHPADPAMRRRAAEAGLTARATTFAAGLVARVEATRQELDVMIAKAAPAWPVDQLPAIDRAILRLALAELATGSDTPRAVVADEAVELAKLLASESSPRFINGVLGTVLG